MPRCRVTRRVHFNAAHRLHNPDATEAWNQATYGVCNHPNYHGHNYELDLSVEGEINPQTGYVMDLNHLKDLAQEHLLRHLDHKNLNLDVPWFRDLVPTSENIAVVCWRELRPRFPPTCPCTCACGKRRGTMSTTKATDDGGPAAMRPARERVAHVERRDAHLEPFADKVREILAARRRGSRAGRAGQDAGARRVIAPVPHPGLPPCRSPM